MKSLTATLSVAAAGVAAWALVGCAQRTGENQYAEPTARIAPGTTPGQVVIASPSGVSRPPYAFSREDERLLEEIQHGAFNWMMAQGQGPYGLVPDRSSAKVISTAGVGFQLAALCVSVEHGWITRDDAQRRALGIVRTLRASPAMCKAGLYQHFVDLTADGKRLQLHGRNLEQVVSTIDSSLLLCGAIVAGQYFGGEVGSEVNAMLAEVDWTFFQSRSSKPGESGRISLGWKPRSIDDPNGAGTLLPYLWLDTGCEHRLVTFLACCPADPAKRIDPAIYYGLRRQVGDYPGAEPMVWFPYSGAIFVNQFSHIFLNYAAMGPDDPAAAGVENRPRVDWWENSRRVTRLHYIKAIENPRNLPGFGPQAWGLTASDRMLGYQVPGVFPNRVALEGERAELDYSTYTPKDDWGDGTIAPYGAGMSIMFEPQLSLGALRHYRELASLPEYRGLWGDPAADGFGFADAFHPGTKWVGLDRLAIDQLPLMLAIENARTGFVWKLFLSHSYVQGGVERLRFKLGKLAENPRKNPQQ